MVNLVKSSLLIRPFGLLVVHLGSHSLHLLVHVLKLSIASLQRVRQLLRLVADHRVHVLQTARAACHIGITTYMYEYRTGLQVAFSLLSSHSSDAFRFPGV